MSETYEVGELVQVMSYSTGEWHDAKVAKIGGGFIYGDDKLHAGHTGGMGWSRSVPSSEIRKHPSRGWKVGDECEVLAKPTADFAKHEPPEWRPARVAQFIGGLVQLEFANGVLWVVSVSDIPTRMRRPQANAAPQPAVDANRIIKAMSGLKHGPAGTGERGPCEAAEEFMRVAPPDPLDEVVDGTALRELLDQEEMRQRTERPRCQFEPFTAAQRAAVSAHRSTELRARVAAGPSADAERWREGQRRERTKRGPRVVLDCAENL
ncbi:MAG TPA: hypothetical protein VFQ42_22490 [Mycobacterium sp.]|nr:hypothetical protein [Mycobacterium sp.]